jgi:hypothetical protein
MSSTLVTSILTGLFALAGGLGGVLLSNHLTQRSEKTRLAIEDARQLLADRRRVYAAYLGLVTSMLEEIDRVSLYLPDEDQQQLSMKHETKIVEGAIQYYGRFGDQLQPALAEVKLVATPHVAELADRLSEALLSIGTLIDSQAPFTDYYPRAFQTIDMIQVVGNAMRIELGQPDALEKSSQQHDWPWLPDRPSRESYIRKDLKKRRQPPD